MNNKNSIINRFILYYIILKIFITLIFFLIMPIFFHQSIFKFNDFEYYSSGDLGVGPNIAYRWLIWLLEIKSIDTTLPIFIASIINISVDISWIYLLSKYLNLRGLFFFILMLGLHPYAAVYTMKFTTDLFAKICLLFFYRELLCGGFDEIKKKTLSWGEFLFLTLLTLIRNPNLFVTVPYFFLKLRNNPLRAVMIVFSFSCILYFLSIGYMDDLHLLPSLPWSLNYVKELLGIESNLVALLVGFLARVLLLFGGREKLFTEGIESFLVWGIPSVELFVYIFLGCVQFFGFCVAIRFLFQRHGVASLVLLMPISVFILTVVHQRYLIPYIPICLFGLALAFDTRAGNYKF